MNRDTFSTSIQFGVIKFELYYPQKQFYHIYNL